MTPEFRQSDSPPNRFVGRAKELASLEATFARGARLVSVLGPPGMGKSRLARRFAELALVEGRFTGGVHVCDLAAVASAADFCAALGRALDINFRAAGDAPHVDSIGAIGAALDARGDSLVVLDEFERFVTSAASAVGELLRASSRARLLVTSRVRLDLTGEVAHVLGPLSLPEEGRPVEASEAVELFVDRARAARPEFTVSEHIAAAVAAVVRELDGIPLAIELCASRMGVLTPTQFLERLPQWLDLLATRVRDVPARQRTLRGAIGASLDMLAPIELAALAQVSVFRGGFDVEAAEAVIDLGAHAKEGAPLLVDVLESLAGKSLVYTRPSEGLAARLRFGLYNGIRDAAAEQLVAAGRAADAGERHARFYLEFVRSVSKNLPGETAHAAHPFAIDRENLVAAHAWFVSYEHAGAASDALEIALALEELITRWGPFELLLSLVDRVLVMRADLPEPIVARGLAVRGRALHLLGRLDESAEALARAMDIASPGDARLRGRIANELGTVRYEQGRLGEAEAVLEQALSAGLPHFDPNHEACVECALAQVAIAAGDGARARSRLERAIAIASAADLEGSAATARMLLGVLEVQEGRIREAERCLDSSFVAATRAPVTLILHQNFRGTLRQEQGALSEARAAYEAAISLARHVGSERWLGVAMGLLGLLHAEMGDLSAARSMLERACEHTTRSGDCRSRALYAAALAAVRARAGDVAEAERIGAAARALIAGIDDELLVLSVEIYLAGLVISRAARAPDDEALARAASAAREFVATNGEEGKTASAAARSFYVRLARRVIARTFEVELLPRSGSAIAGQVRREADGESTPRGGVVLVVSPDGRTVRLPNGREFVFQRGKALRFLLLRLVDARLIAPGRALSMTELFSSGWPGERASPEAAQNRVYVAVSRLRKLGLQGLLLSRDDGFLLDPSVPTYRAERAL